MQQTFYNTINLKGPDLQKAVADATKQDEAIFLIFKNTRLPWTASQITKATLKAGRNWPIWSNRRSITNLKSKGELVMLSETKPGPQGKPEHQYQLNFEKYPTPQGLVQQLF